MPRVKLALALALESLRQPLRNALQSAAGLGAAGIQVDAVGDLDPVQLSQTGRKQLRHLVRSLGLELAALGCPLRHGFDVPQQLDVRVAHVQRVMTLAYDLGPRLVSVFSGNLSAEADQVGRELMAQSLEMLANHADRVGVTLAVENGGESPAELREAVERFAAGGLGVHFDPATALTSGHDPAEAIAALHGLVRLVTARDARSGRSGKPGQEVPLGHGDIDWIRFLGALEEIGYRGWIVVRRGDCRDPLPEIQQAMAFLKRLGAMHGMQS